MINIEKTKLNFALVGCGRISKKHISAINEISNANLVAVCDLKLDLAKQKGKENNVNYYSNYDDMLKNENVDVVNILTPSGDHAKHTIDIVKKYKKHVIVEKPMALRLKDADEMIKVCDSNGVKLFVVKQNRYNLAIQKLKNALNKNRLGKIVLATTRVRWCRPQEYYDQADWRGTWWGDGGVLTNQASHHIDLLEWLVGNVKSVFCTTKTQLVDIDTEDTATAVLEFENGALGIIEATTACRPKDLEGSISVLGSKGTVVVGGFAANQIVTWNFTDSIEEDKTVVNDFKELPPNVYGFGHVAYLKNVIECILEGKKALVNGLEGRKSLELINALYESAETGKKINLHFEPKRCRLGNEK